MANPFPLQFEELIPLFHVTPGSRCTVIEGPAPPDFPDLTPGPISSIRLDQNWAVTFEWQTLGELNYLMAGEWQLSVYLEQMGGGEFHLPNNTKTIAYQSSPANYVDAFSFPAGTVDREGAFKLVTTVDMVGPTGYQGPISAVGEGPIIRFYEVGL